MAVILIIQRWFLLLLNSSCVLEVRYGWKSVECHDLDLLYIFDVRWFDHL